MMLTIFVNKVDNLCTVCYNMKKAGDMYGR